MRLALQLVELERGVREVSLRRGDLEQRRARQVRAGRVVEQGQAEIHVLELDRVELLRLLLLRLGRSAPQRRHHRPDAERHIMDRELDTRPRRVRAARPLLEYAKNRVLLTRMVFQQPNDRALEEQGTQRRSEEHTSELQS